MDAIKDICWSIFGAVVKFGIILFSISILTLAVLTKSVFISLFLMIIFAIPFSVLQYTGMMIYTEGNYSESIWIVLQNHFTFWYCFWFLVEFLNTEYRSLNKMFVVNNYLTKSLDKVDDDIYVYRYG